jgi:transposase-like protein
MAKKKASRKEFTPEQREAAVQMLYDGSSYKEVAAEVGCSIASLQVWRKQHVEGRKTKRKETAPANHTPVADPTPQPPAPTHKVSFEKFVRKYWEKRAVDVVLMPPEKSAEVVKLINDTLQYAYDNL